MSIITYSLPDHNYAVDTSKIPDAVLQRLTELAARGTQADRMEFVTTLARYPSSAYKVLPPNAQTPSGPISMPGPELLDTLDMDVIGIMALAMLITMEMDQDFRKMGITLSDEQFKQLVLKNMQTLLTDRQANKKQKDADIGGAVAQGITGGFEGAAGGASFAKMAQGERLARDAKSKEKQNLLDRDSFQLEARTNEDAIAEGVKNVQATKVKLDQAEAKVKETRKEIDSLREKVLQESDPQKRADDDACRARLERADAKLAAARKEHEDLVQELKELDLRGTCPNGLDPDIYRFQLTDRISNKEAEIKQLQADRDTLVYKAATDHPAAAWPFVQRDLDAVRTDISSTRTAIAGLKKDLDDIQVQQKKLDDDHQALIAERAKEGKTVEQAELDAFNDQRMALAARESKTRQELASKEAELQSLEARESRVATELRDMVPQAARDALAPLKAREQDLAQDVEDSRRKMADVDDKLDKVELDLIATRKDVSDLEKQVQALSPGPSPQLQAARDNLALQRQKLDGLEKDKNGLQAQRNTIDSRLQMDIGKLKEARDQLELSDLHKLDVAEGRLKDEEAVVATLKGDERDQNTALEAARNDKETTLADKRKKLEESADEIETLTRLVSSKVEEGAAWRTGMTAVGKVLGAFIEGAKAEDQYQASDTRSLGQYYGREFEIGQIVQGIYATFGDNALSGLSETRQMFGKMLDDAAASMQKMLAV